MSTPTKTVVVIDDERTIQATLAAILERHGYQVHLGPTASLGRKKVEEVKPDLVLLDLGLPDAEGLDVLRQLKADFPALPVMILTAHDTLANAIEAIKLGAFHFLSKPYAAEELLSLCSRALEQRELVRQTETLTAANEALEKRLRAAEEKLAPVSVSRRMREVEELIARVAPSEANILLTGESGVGKEVYAGEVHRLSERAAGPMIKLNCGAFPANMIEAELFGYAKGAFTGAVAAFPGMLAEARGGTLFLDEITEMPLDLQTRFLRVLQEREFRPLGTTKTIRADFRLIAACNRPIGAAVSEGRLRQDLYYRLKTFEIEIPPLRERREDMTKLVDTFLHRFAKQLRKPVPQLEAEALEMLRAYPWPGNVRELQNAVEHALVLCDGPVLGTKFLPREIRLAAFAAAPGSGAIATTTGGSLEEAEKATVLAALHKTGGNKKQAAEILGIHRPTLYAKMRRHGIGQ
jgi:DNA-binding NtrC family response regulator